jgi:hypothetical protein
MLQEVVAVLPAMAAWPVLLPVVLMPGVSQRSEVVAPNRAA